MLPAAALAAARRPGRLKVWHLPHLAAVRDAESAVHKRLHLGAAARGDAGDVAHRQLAPHHDARHAVLRRGATGHRGGQRGVWPALRACQLQGHICMALPWQPAPAPRRPAFHTPSAAGDPTAADQPGASPAPRRRARRTCRANSAPSGDTTLIWVEPWTGRPGATRRISSTTPRSCAGQVRWGGKQGQAAWSRKPRPAASWLAAGTCASWPPQSSEVPPGGGAAAITW